MSSIKDVSKGETSPVVSSQTPEMDDHNLEGHKLVHKIDLRLMTSIIVVYLWAFLDRINIGNAAVFGLAEELGIDGVRYSTVLSIYFVPVIFLELPSNILLRYVRPNIWLSSCMIGYGVVTICQGLTHSYGGLLACRFFLGVFEAGIFPGCIYLLSVWYTRDEAQKRFTFFFVANTLSGAFGGLLAAAIGNLNGSRGWLAWRWIFIIEGSISAFLSIFVFMLLPNFPETVKWLSAEERELLAIKFQKDRGNEPDEEFSWKLLWEVIMNYKGLAAGFLYFGLNMPGYSVSFFAPTILNAWGLSPVNTQLKTVPVYIVAFVLALSLAVISDYLRHRFYFLMGALTLSLLGTFILLFVHDQPNTTEYAAMYLLNAGVLSSTPIALCWFNQNMQSRMRKSIGSAWQITMGMIAGIIATYSFRSKDAPKFTLGYAITIVFIGIAMLSAMTYKIGVVRENKRLKQANTNGDSSAFQLYD